MNNKGLSNIISLFISTLLGLFGISVSLISIITNNQQGPVNLVIAILFGLILSACTLKIEQIHYGKYRQKNNEGIYITTNYPKLFSIGLAILMIIFRSNILVLNYIVLASGVYFIALGILILLIMISHKEVVIG
ncbi:MAG: hypothetical protein HYZ25_18445 [Chloroflexi bacterium]|nr:hypothetical protein [Chloroflexota bacterium]